MNGQLLKFWDKAQFDRKPFIHCSDDVSEKHIQSDVNCYADFINAFEAGSLSTTALHLGLLPQPYLGDLKNADILVLLVNPGLSACDYHVEENYPAYFDHLISSIRQETNTHMFLNPRWAWTSGFEWWERKLRNVAQIIASERFSGHYGRALEDLSRRIASVELVPYHSFKFGTSKKLASSIQARKFVGSLGDDQTVIVTRGVSNWDLPDAPNIVKYSPGQARSASLAPSSPGGQSILRHYDIECDT